MPVKINWVATTSDIVEQRIYRTATRIDATNLPASPLATLPPTDLTYTDNTAVQGQFYYYTVVSVKGTDVAVSRSLPVAYLADLGVGPQTLLRGDWEYGYFGTLTIDELVSFSALRDAMVNTSFAANTATGLVWHKMAYQGKIIYFTNSFEFTNFSFKWMYDNGFAYGDLAVPTAIKAAWGDIPQGKTVTIASRAYKIRMPTSRANHLDSTNADVTGGDVDVLFAPTRLYSRYIAGKYGVDSYANNLSLVYYMTLDYTGTAITGNVAITRGNNVNGTVSPDFMQMDLSNTPLINIISPGGGSNYRGKLILELQQ